MTVLVCRLHQQKLVSCCLFTSNIYHFSGPISLFETWMFVTKCEHIYVCTCTTCPFWLKCTFDANYPIHITTIFYIAIHIHTRVQIPMLTNIEHQMCTHKRYFVCICSIYPSMWHVMCWMKIHSILSWSNKANDIFWKCKPLVVFLA